jgi:hypothetical protein
MNRSRLFGLVVAVLALFGSPADAATLYIEEYASGVSQLGTTQAQVPPQPSIATQTIALSGTSAQSSPFNAKTHVVALICDEGCSIFFGTNPTATTLNFLLQQGSQVRFGVSPGQIVAAIANAAGNSSGGSGALVVGTTTITGGANTKVLFDNSGVLGEYTVTGSGNAVLANSPTLVTPALGTPSALVLTNATGLPNASVIGLGTAALVNTGTSGATIPLLNGANTWSAAQTFPAGSAATPSLIVGAAGYGLFQGTSQIGLSVAGASKLDYGLTNSGAWSFSGNVYVNGDIRAANGNFIYWNSGSLMSNPSDGQILLLNAAQNSFGRLMFGGTTSSFPALKRSAATFVVRLADDSGNADISMRLSQPQGFTVATLPVSPPTGSTAYVTDAVACTFLATLTGGGSAYCPVTYNGAAWVGS